MTLAISGTPQHSNVTNSLSTQITYPSIQAGDLVIAITTENAGPLSGVSGGTLGAFTNRIAEFSGSTGQYIEIWAKISNGALTNEVVTATQLGANFLTLDVLAISGANTGGALSAAFDGASVGNTTDPVLISTSSSNTMIVGGIRTTVVSGGTAGAGFTIISGIDFQGVEYKIVSSPQTNLSVGWGTGAGGNGSVADAIVQLSSGVPAVLFAQACL